MSTDLQSFLEFIQTAEEYCSVPLQNRSINFSDSTEVIEHMQSSEKMLAQLIDVSRSLADAIAK